MWRFNIVQPTHTPPYVIGHQKIDYYDSVVLYIAKTLGHTLYTVEAWHGDTLCGVAQAMHLHNYLFDRALIVTAFGTAHGALWQNETAQGVLLNGLVQLGQQLKAPHVQWRLRQPMAAALLNTLNVPYSIDNVYCNFAGALVDDIETLPRKARANVRAAFAEPDLTYSEGDFDAFLWCYRRSMRDLGTPMHKRSFYQGLTQRLPHTLAVVWHKGTPLCATLAWHNTLQGVIAPYYGGGTPAARLHNGFDRLYFELMQRAKLQGFTHIDFGRSKQGTGAYDYKKRRGFTPQPLYYLNIHLNNRPPAVLNPLNPKFSRAIAMWQKLPLWVVNSGGWLIARELG